jgi:hypothetical protein
VSGKRTREQTRATVLRAVRGDGGTAEQDDTVDVLDQIRAINNRDAVERATAVAAAGRNLAETGKLDEVTKVRVKDYVTRNDLLKPGAFNSIVREARAHAAAGDDMDSRAPSVATQLVELAQDLYTFGISDLDEPYAIPATGPKVVAMLKGSKTSLRALLSKEYFSRTGRAANQQALADALLVIHGIAQDQEPSELFIRCGQHDGALWLDLGDNTGRAVKITADGWSMKDEPPVLFKRTALTGALPEPEPRTPDIEVTDCL